MQHGTVRMDCTVLFVCKKALQDVRILQGFSRIYPLPAVKKGERLWQRKYRSCVFYAIVFSMASVTS